MVWLWPCLVTSLSNLHMQSWGENICNSKHWGSKQTNSLHFRYSWKTAPALRSGFWDAHIVSSNGIQRLWVQSVELRSRLLIHPLTAPDSSAPALRNLRSAKASLPIAQATYCLFSHAQYLEGARSQRCGEPVLSFLPQVWAGVPGNSCFFVFPNLSPKNRSQRSDRGPSPLPNQKGGVWKCQQDGSWGLSNLCIISEAACLLRLGHGLKSMDLLHQGGMKIHLTSYCYDYDAISCEDEHLAVPSMWTEGKNQDFDTATLRSSCHRAGIVAATWVQ